MKTHRDLDVWKGSMDLVYEMYRITGSFPKTEIFGLTSQIRRAAVSIPANISEGSARRTSKEFRYFLRVSYGSLSELETLLTISTHLDYMTPENFENLREKIKLITVQLCNLMKALENKIQNQN